MDPGPDGPELETQIATDLVERIRTGDRSAEAEMVDRYHRGLLYVLKHRSGDPELAKDVCQDTFAIALKNLRLGKLKEPAKLAAYLRGIGVRLISAEWRKTQRRLTTADSDAVARTEDQGLGPLNNVSQQELGRLVRRLIEELRVPRDREILIRFCLKGEDKEIICHDLGIDDPVHFNRVFFRAKQRLKELALRDQTIRGLVTGDLE